MERLSRNVLLSVLIIASFSGTCCALYKTFTDCDKLTTFLRAVPNTCALFIDGQTGNKKNMLKQLESDYTDMNIRFALVDVSNVAMRRCADEKNIFQYPSFAIFKKCDLVKVVRGNPTNDDLRYQINNQLARDPMNWTLMNNKAFHICRWANRQEKLAGMLPEQCKQEVLPYMEDVQDMAGLLSPEQQEELRERLGEEQQRLGIPEQMRGAGISEAMGGSGVHGAWPAGSSRRCRCGKHGPIQSGGAVVVPYGRSSCSGCGG